MKYFLLFFVILLVSCESNVNKQENYSADKHEFEDINQGSDKSDFDAFKKLYIPNSSFKKWSLESQSSLIVHPNLFEEGELDKQLARYYTEIPIEKTNLIDIEFLKKIDINKPQIDNSKAKYEYYAFSKIEYANYILFGTFVKKKERVDNEYHTHVFLLSTYSFNGQNIDNIIWWSLIDDMIQYWDDIEVKSDMFLVGTKDEMHDEHLNEISRVISIDSLGYFRENIQ